MKHISLQQTRLPLGDILNYIGQPKDAPGKIKALAENNTSAMRNFCRLAFGKADPFEDIRAGDHVPESWDSRIENGVSTESFYDLVKQLAKVADKSHNMLARRDALLDILEWTSREEAEMVLAIVNRRFQTPKLPRLVVHAVYPELNA